MAAFPQQVLTIRASKASTRVSAMPPCQFWPAHEMGSRLSCGQRWQRQLLSGGWALHGSICAVVVPATAAATFLSSLHMGSP
jgi:hypothetical protein